MGMLRHGLGAGKNKGAHVTGRAFVAAGVFLVLFSFLVYYFSPDSQVRVLACSGNYLYTETQIYDMAGVSSRTRLWLTPLSLLEGRVEQSGLIESCTISRSENKLSFAVTEKTVIGYVVSEDNNYLLTSDGQMVPVDARTLRSIIHFPLLSDFSDEQLQQIAAQFRTAEKYLSRDIVAQIAEIVPYKSSYDDNMLRITMNDGNVIFSAMDDLVMLSYYQEMLQKLQGQSVCLLLDKENSAINKVACSYLNMSQEERIAYWEQVLAEQKEEQARADAEAAAAAAENEPVQNTADSDQSSRELEAAAADGQNASVDEEQ